MKRNKIGMYIVLIILLVFAFIKSVIIVKPPITKIFYGRYLKVVDDFIIAVEDENMKLALSFCYDDLFESVINNGILDWISPDNYKVYRIENYILRNEVYIYIQPMKQFSGNNGLLLILKKIDGEVLITTPMF